MRPKRIMAEQNDGSEAKWNSTSDRWSRKAKHQMTISEKCEMAREWTKGDMAIFEGQTVEICIPNGPNSTVGVLLNGKTKMVREKNLTRMDEGVLGGVQPLSPINRIMQLAGVSNPTLVMPVDQDAEPLTEATGTGIVEQLFRVNTNKYKKTSAARLATIGEMLISIAGQVSELANDMSPNDTDNVQASGISEQLSVIQSLPGLGTVLVRAAKKLDQARPQ